MKKSKSLVLLGGICLAMMLVLLPFVSAYAGSESKDLPKRISFASHRVGTGNNAVATALCKVASEHSGMMVIVLPGSGASAWIEPMNKSGTPELGFAHILDIWWGYSGEVSPVPLPGNPLGTEPFYPASKNLRVLAAGPRLWVGIIARADAPFKTLRGAKGKRMAGGFVAHPGAYSGLIACLANQGLSEKDFKVVVVPGAKGGVTALIEGRVELAMAAVGMPVATEANAKFGICFLPLSMDPADIKEAMKVFPGAAVKTRKPGPPGVKVPTPILTYPLMITTSTHLSNKVAYNLVKTWWDYHKETWKMHPIAKGWAPKDFVIKNVTVPYHPGAIKFYKEQGAWDSEMDKIQERLLGGEYPFLD